MTAARKPQPGPADSASRSPAPKRSTTSQRSERAGSKATDGEAVGEGGETHQRATDGAARLTTNHGVPISDDQNSLRAGDRGPTLLEDFILREKIFHFDHERIPERIVHARGSGAHGIFECTNPIPELTTATLFQEKGHTVPVFVRFSTVAGGAGSSDTPRDIRGFAVKFYTEDGNWDLVGNNIPVFFIQDAIKFPDLVHAVKMEADSGYPQAATAHDTFWDFASLMPETTHMLMWSMSDRTIPRSLRMMEGFGVHTFRLIDTKGQSRFVKFHWRPELGAQSTLWDEAVKIAGADPDFHRRDLHDSIAAGAFPAWGLFVQVFDEAFADEQPYDVLDATKLIPEELVPLRQVGRMVLNRNPENFFAETEQVAFLPTNVIPGIDFSDDPLLQGRLFSYLDTQHSRLGTTNFHQIPINAPKCPFGNFQRDGHMQMTVPTGRLNYEPNSLAGGADPGPRETEQGFRTLASRLPEGATKVRVRSDRFADHYSQATMFWQSQTPVEQSHLASSFVFELSKVNALPVVERMLANLGNVDEGLVQRVADGLGLPVPAPSPVVREKAVMPASPALSMQTKYSPTLEGRKVGVLIGDGTDAKALDNLVASITQAGGTVMTIGSKRHLVLGSEALTVDGQLAGTPSVFFDAVALLLGDADAQQLVSDSAAIEFVHDAFVHLKAIGATAASRPLLDRAGVIDDEGVTAPDGTFVAAAARRFFDREPSVRTLA